VNYSVRQFTHQVKLSSFILNINMINIYAIALLRWALQLGQVNAECIK